MSNNIRKKFGNATIGAGGAGGVAMSDPEVYVIQPNNQLIPSSYNGIRYIKSEIFDYKSAIDLDNPIELVTASLPDGIGIGINVTTGTAKLIVNTYPAPAYDLLAGSFVELNPTSVNISGAISGGPWTAYTPINVF